MRLYTHDFKTDAVTASDFLEKLSELCETYGEDNVIIDIGEDAFSPRSLIIKCYSERK